MRDLYEEIQDYYLLNEALSKNPTSPIETDEDHSLRSTNLTGYHNDSEFVPANRYHKDFTGVTHLVSWGTHKEKGELSEKERKDALHDAMHLHYHFIKHGAEVGDVIKNTPLEDEGDKGGNKRARIYAKRAGFGELNDSGLQYGIIKQHPHDHPEEHLRGQRYLHPLSHEEIATHDDAPSAGSSDDKVRHIRVRHMNLTFNQTKKNNSVHQLMSDTTKPGYHEIEHDPLPSDNKVQALRDMSAAHHANIVRNTKEGDKISKRLRGEDKNLDNISANHALGFGSPSTKRGKDTMQHGIVDKTGRMIPHNET